MTLKYNFTALGFGMMVLTVLVVGVPIAQAQDHQRPITVKLIEGSQYIPKDALPQPVTDASKPAPAAMIVRSLVIAVTNVSDREITVNVDYALFKMDTENKVLALPMRDVKGQKGQASLFLRPGETRQVRGEATLSGAVLANGTLGKSKNLGDAIDFNRDYYRQYYQNFNTPNGNITEAPTASPSRADTLKKPKLAAEIYYGHSVAIYVDGALVFKNDKNPQNAPKFGVTYLK